MTAQDSFTQAYLFFGTGMVIFAAMLVAYVLSQSQFLMDMAPFQAAVDAVLIFDWAILAVIVGSIVSSAFLGSKIDAHPIFLPISVLVVGLATFISYGFTRIPEEMAEHTVVANVFDMMSLTPVVMQNLHIIVMVSSFITLIATYALKGRSGRRGGGTRAPL